MIVLRIVPLILLMALALGVFYFVDRRLLMVILYKFFLFTIQMCALGAYVWLLLLSDSWWAYGLWLLALAALLGIHVVRHSRLSWRLAIPVGSAVVLTIVTVSGVLTLSLPLRILLPVAAVLTASLFETLGSSVRTYARSYANTQAHRYYLLSNGATLLESLYPSIRRALREAAVPQLQALSGPTVAVGSMLFWGMLMGGVTATEALITTLLLCMAVFVASVMATLLTIYFLSQYKKM